MMFRSAWGEVAGVGVLWLWWVFVVCADGQCVGQVLVLGT